MVRLHDHDQLGPAEVVLVDLAAAMTTEVGLRQLGNARQGGSGAHAHRLSVNGVGAGRDDMERIGASLSQVIEHEAGHDRARRVAGAEHQEVGHLAARSSAGASTSSACCACRVAVVRNMRSPRSVRCTIMEATMAMMSPAKVSRRASARSCSSG